MSEISKLVQVVTMTVFFAAESASAQGILDRFTNQKAKVFEECSINYEHFERQSVIAAAAKPIGSFGSTYIRSDKGEWMKDCMGRRGFRLAFDSLAQFDSVTLSRMSREQINTMRKADADRAADDLAGWK